MSEEKSEAQIRNEEEVHRIMMERGYSPASNKKRVKKVFNEDFPFGSIIAGVVGVAIIIGGWVFLQNYIINNQYTNNENEVNIAEENDFTENDKLNEDIKTDIETSDIKTKETNNLEIGDSSSVKQNAHTNNINYFSSENSETNNHRDGFVFDPHHCDAQKEKYDNAMDEADKLNEIWVDNPEAISDALNEAIKKAYDVANSIYQNELTPCKKEMYGQK